MIEKYITGSMLDTTQLVKDMNETIDGFKKDIARVGKDMICERHKFNRRLNEHNEAMLRLKADRHQRVEDLAAFKEQVWTDLEQLVASLEQPQNEQQGSPVQVVSFSASE